MWYQGQENCMYVNVYLSELIMLSLNNETIIKIANLKHNFNVIMKCCGSLQYIAIEVKTLKIYTCVQILVQIVNPVAKYYLLCVVWFSLYK